MLLHSVYSLWHVEYIKDKHHSLFKTRTVSEMGRRQEKCRWLYICDSSPDSFESCPRLLSLMSYDLMACELSRLPEHLSAQEISKNYVREHA